MTASDFAGGRVSKWLKDADCKSARFGVRRFESDPYHHLQADLSIESHDSQYEYMKRTGKWIMIIIGGCLYFLYQKMCSGRFDFPQ